MLSLATLLRITSQRDLRLLNRLHNFDFGDLPFTARVCINYQIFTESGRIRKVEPVIRPAADTVHCLISHA